MPKIISMRSVIIYSITFIKYVLVFLNLALIRAGSLRV